MAAPAQLIDEEDNGPLKVYHGDPLVIEIEYPEDLSGHTFTSQVRRYAASDEVLAEFDVQRIWDGDKTTITLTLAGDSHVDLTDGLTRLIPAGAEADVQESDTNGVPIRTLCRFKLAGIEDVTR